MAEEQGGLAAMSKMAEVKVNDLQHEEILSNFDSFLKLAGNELGSVRDLAKNMTGRHPDQYMHPDQYKSSSNLETAAADRERGGGEDQNKMTSKISFFIFLLRC